MVCQIILICYMFLFHCPRQRSCFAICTRYVLEDLPPLPSKAGKNRSPNLFLHSLKVLQVCVTEGVNIHPLLLEKFIQSCDGDIRKTIMHLQFWFQSKRFRKGILHNICLFTLLDVHVLCLYCYLIRKP